MRLVSVAIAAMAVLLVGTAGFGQAPPPSFAPPGGPPTAPPPSYAPPGGPPAAPPPSSPPPFWLPTEPGASAVGPPPSTTMPVIFAPQAQRTRSAGPEFASFISPLSAPSLFEDPRAVGNIRFYNIYEVTSSGDNAYLYGSENVYAAQIRWTYHELSFILNKLGVMFLNQQGFFSPMTAGITELNLGAKWTFIHDPVSEFLGAVGITFEIPIGPAKVFQNTGSLSVIPYFSLGKRFDFFSGDDIHYVSTIGYAFADSDRSQYFYWMHHIDVDLFNQHRWYPLLEFAWYQYTKGGKTLPFNYEGRDLINFGNSGAGGQGCVSIMPGFRYRPSDDFQIGAGVEFPITGDVTPMKCRITFDMLFRF